VTNAAENHLPKPALRLIRVAALVASVLVGLAVLLAACGGGDGESASGTGGTDVDATGPATTGAPETSSTTEPTTTTTEPPPPPRSVSLAFTGDLLPHGPVVRQAAANATAGEYDFRPMFDEVRDIISAADFAFCHLESPLSADNTGIQGYPVFNAPRELAEAALDAGYDACSLSSNHAYDRGRDGVFSTVSVMEDVGLGHVGMSRTPEERAAARIYDVDGVAVGHLSYTYSINGFVLPDDEPHLVSMIDREVILEEAAATKAAGAEFVVVSMHWGQEYRHEPIEDQTDLVEPLLASDDIDLLVGHHAHVVQPIDKVGDEYVVYGLGNFVSNQSSACCVAASQDGVIVQVQVSEESFGSGLMVERVEAVPTWVDRADYTVVAVPQALAGEEISAGRRGELEASLERTTSALALLGDAPDLLAAAPPASTSEVPVTDG
jgi:poly-gamma-glutamate synthesis protein (capsule biosynthesis protein)